MSDHPRGEIVQTRALGPFTFRWPDAVEEFEGGWEASVRIDGRPHQVRDGLGGREVYGRERVHTVWLDAPSGSKVSRQTTIRSAVRC